MMNFLFVTAQMSIILTCGTIDTQLGKHVIFWSLFLNSIIFNLKTSLYFRESMTPTFFTKDDVNRIFRTGRNINFLYTICKSKPDLTPSRIALKNLRNSGGVFSNHYYLIIVNVMYNILFR